MPLTSLSLFSGLGGMDAGLNAAGFETLGLVESGRTQQASLRANGFSELLGDGDVNTLANTLTPASLGLQAGELDLIAGGPPCQPFSMAAQWAANGRRGMIDPRATTVLSTIRLVERFLPKFLLLENVAGFIQGSNSALSFLESELRSIGERAGVVYTKHVSLVNAADYGIPQNRRRAVVIFERDGGTFSLPPKTHSGTPRTAWDALHDIPPEEKPDPRGKWADLLPIIPPGQNYQWLTAKGGGPELFGYRTKFWNFLLKLAPDAPSWTLSASPGPATGPFHWDNRPLSIGEQLRLQSFPDGWQVSGDSRSQTLQVGNATPPLLAEVVGRSIANSLGYPSSKTPSLLKQRASTSPPTPPFSRVVPDSFRAQVSEYPAHRGAGFGPSPRVPEATVAN